MKSILLFLAGLLVGANIVYFVMSRDDRAATTSPAPMVPSLSTSKEKPSARVCANTSRARSPRIACR